MERRDVFIEVNGEEVEWAFAGHARAVIGLELLLVVHRSFSGKRSDLLVTAGVAWDEEDRDTFDLLECQQMVQSPRHGLYSRVCRRLYHFPGTDTESICLRNGCARYQSPRTWRMPGACKTLSIHQGPAVLL